MDFWIIVVSLTLSVQMATTADVIQQSDSPVLLPSGAHTKESSVPGACAPASIKCSSLSTQLVENKYGQCETQASQQFDQFSPKIVNGMDAAPDEFPYQVQITSEGHHHCGGVILNEIYILTAAHCFFTQEGVRITDDRFLRVTAGQHSIKVPEIQEQVRKIEAVTVHKAYDFNTNYNEIALVRLQNSLELNKEVHAPIFPEANCDATGLEAFLTGWGSLAEGGRSSDILQKTIVPIISNKECAEAYGSILDWELPDTALCAGNSGGDTDACKGDSGGPLAVKLDNGSYIVVGLVSYGQGCAEGYLGVYTKLSSYINWINSNAELTSTIKTPSNQEA